MKHVDRQIDMLSLCIYCIYFVQRAYKNWQQIRCPVFQLVVANAHDGSNQIFFTVLSTDETL
jgi:hypothetical protein